MKEHINIGVGPIRGSFRVFVKKTTDLKLASIYLHPIEEVNDEILCISLEGGLVNTRTEGFRVEKTGQGVCLPTNDVLGVISEGKIFWGKISLLKETLSPGGRARKNHCALKTCSSATCGSAVRTYPSNAEFFKFMGGKTYVFIPPYTKKETEDIHELCVSKGEDPAKVFKWLRVTQRMVENGPDRSSLPCWSEYDHMRL